MVIDFTGGAAHSPYTDTLSIVAPVPVFTDANGNPLTSLSSDTLVTTLHYLNDSDKNENLVLITAVYSPDGRLVYASTDAKVVGADDMVAFSTKIDMPGNINGVYSNNKYYVIVFLWDSQTFVPVREKFTF